MSERYGFGNEELKGEDSIRRLGLSARTLNALVRSDVYTVSLLLDILALPNRPEFRTLGAKGWAEIEEAVERPLLPLKDVLP